MSLLITGGKKVDKYYAKQLLKYFCQKLESGQYREDDVIQAAVTALEKISTEDKEFAKTFANALKEKYRDVAKFQKLVL